VRKQIWIGTRRGLECFDDLRCRVGGEKRFDGDELEVDGRVCMPARFSQRSRRARWAAVVLDCTATRDDSKRWAIRMPTSTPSEQKELHLNASMICDKFLTLTATDSCQR
jgi:hypothetical protein